MSRVVFLAPVAGGGTVVLGKDMVASLDAAADETAIREWQRDGKVALVGSDIRGARVAPIAATTATVNWTVDQACTAMKVDYGTTAAYGSSLAGTPAAGVGAVTAALTGLTTATLYHYRISVTCGTALTQTPDATFTTA